MKFLIIQTAFPGDVILATPVLEKLHKFYPDSQIDVLVRKGNETLFTGHPFLNNVFAWDKKQNKLWNLAQIILKIRGNKYNVVINIHRFASSGIVTMLSGAKQKIGFDKNPLSFFYTKKFKHSISKGKHEVERNLELINHLTDNTFLKPALYPTSKDFEKVRPFKTAPYLCIAPVSVWFTKQVPTEKWIELINIVKDKFIIYLIGSWSDIPLCNQIIESTGQKGVINLAGKLSFLESAALMRDGVMNYANDSAPVHIASSVNAPITVFFCSTIPAFGFGPLSDKSYIIETEETLTCRPCGLHGFKACPLKHFRCATTIKMNTLFSLSLQT
jgi:heptosyltransferase-2